MKRALLSLAALLIVLVLFGRLRVEKSPSVTEEEVSSSVPPEVAVPAVLPSSAAAQEAAREEELAFENHYFPGARVVSRVADPVDATGRQRVIETVETSMKQRYVRVEKMFVKDSAGRRQAVSAEVAMVANQLLLEKPESLAAEAFETLLRQAGAVEVKRIGPAFLATFVSQPENPRALDLHLARVREVAGAEVTVEPNYIRKLF